MSAVVTIAGRLGKDPELKFSPNGTAVAKFSVVTAGRRKDGDQWVDVDTTWWNVTAFKRLAENVAESLTKGALVIVVGRLKQRSWETPDGEKRSTMELVADHVGPDLTWDAAPVRREPRQQQQTGAGQTWTAAPPPADDPWSQPTVDEPPF